MNVNDKSPMTNAQCQMPNQRPSLRGVRLWSLVIGIWSFIGHWSLRQPVVAGKFAIERGQADAQQAGSLFFVATGLRQGPVQIS